MRTTNVNLEMVGLVLYVQQVQHSVIVTRRISMLKMLVPARKVSDTVVLENVLK